jgi:peptidoglycan/xylan/chitin deacetylase (PgdA/CDA1 family)
VTWTSLAEFKAGLDYLAAHFTILHLEEAWCRLCSDDLPGACAAITFDDGDPSVADYCVPLLERKGIPATLFLNSACFEGAGHYWFSILTFLQQQEVHRPGAPAELGRMSHELRTTRDPVVYAALRARAELLGNEARIPERRCVSPEWLGRLDEGLFAIGAHGHQHERYALMSTEWQRRDLRRNFELLRQFRCFRPMFAFPFGRPHDYNRATLETAAENGLIIWAAAGGINVSERSVGLRIPSDGRPLRPAVRHEMLGS